MRLSSGGGWGYASGEEENQSARAEENKGGGLGDGGRSWRGCFRGDGEVVVVGAGDGVGEVDQAVGAGVDGGGVGIAGGGDEGDECGTGENTYLVEAQTLACVADAGVEVDIEGLAADSVDGSGGGGGGDGDEVVFDREGELLRKGEGVGVGVAGDGEEVGGVGVGGAGEDQSRGEERECEESFAHGGIPFSDWCEVRVRSLLGGVK